MKVPETTELNLERAELIRKLDKEDNYKSDDKDYDPVIERQKDEQRLGEIQKEIAEIIQEKIRNIDIDKVVEKKQQPIDLKEARRILNQKWAYYRDVCDYARKVVYAKYQPIKNKKYELEEKFRDGKITEKEFISEILKY